MAEILGFGVNVYRQYESGEVPSISNARLIQVVKDPTEFKKLVLAANVINGNALENVLKKIDELITSQSDFNVIGLPKYLMTGLQNGRASGSRPRSWLTSSRIFSTISCRFTVC
jgi:hypothetical protein